MADLTLVLPPAPAEPATVRTRTHVLTVTKGEDWFEDQQDWTGSVACLAPALCDGWMQCHHPYGSENDGRTHGLALISDAWATHAPRTFHDIEHTWRPGIGWVVDYDGCIVQTANLDDSIHTVGSTSGEGTYFVDDQWGAPGECHLQVIEPATDIDTRQQENR